MRVFIRCSLLRKPTADSLRQLSYKTDRTLSLSEDFVRVVLKGDPRSPEAQVRQHKALQIEIQ
jgi:hypothetical protein